MYDINFYIKSHSVIEKLQNNECDLSLEEIIELFDAYRSKKPVVYNIETTNACNMRCRMCPRTTRMDRDITFLDKEFYDSIVPQLSPHDEKLWGDWIEFCKRTYGIGPDDPPSENHFFLYIIPRVIQLHGYGDPLLDDNMSYVIEKLTQHKLESYFSCNPANVDVEKTIEMMQAGLTYIKYSFESTDDDEFKSVRGDAANFTQAYEKTLEVIEKKNELGLDTVVVITMIDINKENQREEFDRLVDAFRDHDVYVYLKSEDQQWYREDETLIKYLEKRNREIPAGGRHETKSIHWLEICKHPWMSMTIKSDGEMSTCMEDYNNEVVFGNAKDESLYDIWNGEKYKQFRRDHLVLTPCIKCTQECDMPLVGDFIK